MTATENPQILRSKVLYTKYINWRSMQFIQDDDFKEFSQEARSKLKASITSNEFAEPFKVWQDPDSQIIYCLDGRHRTKILEELSSEGYDIPNELPATYIDCTNKTEAARMVLVYSSMYAKITTEGFESFVAMYNLDPAELFLSIDIPGLKLPELLDIPQDAFDDEGIGVRNQFGVIVMCADEEDQAEAFKFLSDKGYTCKVVVT